MKTEREYKCEECGTMSVTMVLKWDKVSTRDEEELFAVFECCECNGELWLEANEEIKKFEYGDTIHVEGGCRENGIRT